MTNLSTLKKLSNCQASKVVQVLVLTRCIALASGVLCTYKRLRGDVSEEDGSWIALCYGVAWCCSVSPTKHHHQNDLDEYKFCVSFFFLRMLRHSVLCGS